MGVQLILKGYARLPLEIREEPYLHTVKASKRHGHKVRVLRLPAGEAQFANRCLVVVRLHRGGPLFRGFFANDVHEIQDLQGNCIERSIYECPQCHSLKWKHCGFGYRSIYAQCTNCSHAYFITLATEESEEWERIKHELKVGRES